MTLQLAIYDTLNVLAFLVSGRDQENAAYFLGCAWVGVRDGALVGSGRNCIRATEFGVKLHGDEDFYTS